jgi:putative FmdB family regulatory protein
VPTYQYACTEPQCGHQFEAVQSFSDSALSDCPSCAGRLRKVFSAVGVVFKGPGFYRTDSRESAAKKDNAAANGSANGGANGGAPTKTESTPSSSSSSGSSSSGSPSSGSSSSGSSSSGRGSASRSGGSTAKSAAAS